MKATIFSLGLLLAIGSTTVQAQSPIQIGIKVNTNHSNIKGNLSNLSTSNALGFSGGLTTRYHLDQLFFQADLLYSESKSTLDNTAIKQAKWKSIDLPLAVGYDLLHLKAMKVHVMAGGVYSQVIDDKLSFRDNIEAIDGRWNKNNIKAQVGAGISLGNFSFDLVYARSLNNLAKDFNSKSNHVQVGLSYYFL
ncbi:porin family protein [Myroides sp. mNGS23_01]|nr:porin family protein [Myroides sp. mNGS23_01]WHT39282.1 porin family protein [Myroides sp. mNGS23_01]